MDIAALETDLSLVKTIAGMVALVFPPAEYVADAAGLGAVILQHLETGKTLLGKIEAAITPGGGGITPDHIAVVDGWMELHDQLLRHRAMGQKV